MLFACATVMIAAADATVCRRSLQKFSLLGSTGSIGTQTLEIVAENPDRFEVVALAAGSNIELLAEQVRQHVQWRGWACHVGAFCVERVSNAGTTSTHVMLCALSSNSHRQGTWG